MDGLIEGDTLMDAQGSATRHQRGVEREHGIVRARIDLPENGFEPGRRLLQSLSQRDHFDA